MGLTTAMYTSLSGLVTNSQAITIAGDHIANINTTGFKSSRVSFENQVVQKLRAATGPADGLGGTNPSEIGLGVALGAVARDFSDGSLQTTGVNTELAIDGAGFFVLDFNGLQRFTRAGTFQLDRDNNLSNPGNGGIVQGFGIDDDFNIIEGTLTRLNIPIGSSTLAEATESVRFAGNLNAGGTVASQGAVIESGAVFSDVAGTVPVVAGDALTSIFNGTGTQLFANGDVITVSGATRGSSTVPDHTFQVGAVNTTDSDDNGTTLQDFLTFMEGILGIDTTVSGGLTVNAGGQIVVTGNSGTENELTINAGNVIVNQGGASPSLPFTFNKTQSADGESVRTSFFGFDSLGNELRFDLTAVLEQKTNSGTTWRFYAQSEDDSDISRVLATGTMQFGVSGQVQNVAGNTFQIDLSGTGAQTPQQITLVFDSPSSPITGLSDEASSLAAVAQDGSATGSLEDFNITADGTIIGIYSNGLQRNQGRVALATFANATGLSSEGGNLFSPTPNSGDAAVVTPGIGGSGRIIGGALELSNVEISQEFINLVAFSTGFSASSRVLTTSDQLIQELLSVIR